MNRNVNGKAPKKTDEMMDFRKSPMMLISEISRLMGDKIREKCDAMWEETKVRCGELETGTMRRCSEMIEWAERESQRYWDDVNDRLGEFCAAHKELEGFLGELQPLRRAAS